MELTQLKPEKLAPNLLVAHLSAFCTRFCLNEKKGRLQFPLGSSCHILNASQTTISLDIISHEHLSLWFLQVLRLNDPRVREKQFW